MKAIIYEIRANSLFSIRIPYTWQSALTYPLPPPSSIIGMLANALQRYKNNKHPSKYLDEVEQSVKWAGSKLASPAVIKSYTTSAITKWEAEIGGKPTNALTRQYLFVRNIQILAVIRDENLARELVNALKTAPVTCGDSESIASIERIDNLRDAKESEFQPNSQIETEYPIPMQLEKFDILDGTGRAYIMHERCRKTAKKFPLFSYLLPIREEDGILYPYQFKLKIKKQLKGFEIDNIGKVIARS